MSRFHTRCHLTYLLQSGGAAVPLGVERSSQLRQLNFIDMDMISAVPEHSSFSTPDTLFRIPSLWTPSRSFCDALTEPQLTTQASQRRGRIMYLRCTEWSK